MASLLSLLWLLPLLTIGQGRENNSLPTSQPTGRHGLLIHNFFINPFIQYPNGGAEVNFTDAEVRSIRFTQPILFGVDKVKYNEIFLHKKIPGYVFLRNPTGIPPEAEQDYPRPYFKVLNEFRDRAQDEVQFYSRVFQAGDLRASCLDKKFASKFKDEANQIFGTYIRKYFSPQTVVSVAFRRSLGQAMGNLSEIVFVNSGFESFVYLHYANLQQASTTAVQEAGIFGDSPFTLPAGFTGQSNVQQAGKWMFRISDPASGIASANVDATMRWNLDRNNEKLGFLPDRVSGCSCDQCHSQGHCLSIASGVVRFFVEGTGKCCRCRGTNSYYIGNGFECTDAGTPLPVTYKNYAWSPGTMEGADVQMDVTLIQGNLDIHASVDQSSNVPEAYEIANLLKFSETAWANLALLTASSTTSSTQNLFGLGNVFQRQMNFTLSKTSGTQMAAWSLQQTIWNQVLYKATNTRIIVQQRFGLATNLVILDSNAPNIDTEYGFTSVQRDSLRLESKPAFFLVTALNPDSQDEAPQDYHVNYTDTWTLRPTCDVETRVNRFLLKRRYNRVYLPNGDSVTGLTGTITRLITCSELHCGPGSECIQEGNANATCRCLANYRRPDGQAEGPCRPVCGGGVTLCNENAECTLNTCECHVGFSGDGLVCTPDPQDCRKPAAACRTEDGLKCNKLSATQGIEYRCECNTAQCIRDTEAACRRRVGCSQFADCLPDINVCLCRSGYVGDGYKCIPESCTNSSVCSDFGSLAFCNSSRQCDDCQPPKVLINGRCLQQPCNASSCHELAECNPVTNACVCKTGFTGDGVANCNLMCSTLHDCNRDVSATDLSDLAMHMQCRLGACECRAGYRAKLDKVARILSCQNCETDLNCLPGATCQFEMRFTNARLCKCPEGKFGDGATACHECGDEPRTRCGTNAECKDMPTGRVCRCKYGHSGLNPKAGCTKDATRLMLNVTQLQLYEGQTDVVVSCRVIRGPVRPADLVWSIFRDTPIDWTEEGRVTQYLLDDRKLLHIRHVMKSDALEVYCMFNETEGSEVLKISVLDNPCRQCHTLAFCNYTRPGCQCSFGYTGDGISRCDKASCTEQALCDPSTELCLYSHLTSKYGCECLPGMERLDGRCQRPQQACETSADCHTSAECALVDGRRRCRCREGFSGDGVRHCEKSGPGCNFYNKCVKNSQCLYSQTDGKYRCVCVRGHFGNGEFECRSPADCGECGRNGGRCHQQSVEHRALDGRREQATLDTCRCPEGRLEVKSGNRTLCRTPAQINRKLLVAQGDAILEIPAEPPGPNDLRRGVFVSMSMVAGPNAPRPGTPIVALDYNCRTKEVFWSVYGHQTLYTVKADKAADGSRRWEPFGSGMEMVEGLAVDWTTGNVYYTAQYVSQDGATKGSRFGEIGVIANRRGVAHKKVLFRGPKDDVVRPRGIAVDPFLGKIYYADWDRDDPRIMTAFMNGESHSKLASTNGPLPNGLIRRFDSNFDEICYVGANYPQNQKSVNLTSPTPSSQQPVNCLWRADPSAEFAERRSFRTQWFGEPFGLAYAEGQFYWTNWRTNKIASLEIASRQSLDRGSFGSADNRLMGIVAVSTECPTTALTQKSDHACSENRDYGGCKYLCLAAPNGGVKCACPDDSPGCSP